MSKTQRALAVWNSMIRVCPLILLVGCSPAPYVLVTVEDPLGIASSATALRFGSDFGNMRRLSLDGKRFPTSFAATRAREGTAGLWVDAVNPDGLRAARGFSEVTFASDTVSTATVTLFPACDTAEPDTRCLRDDQSIGYCLNGVCSGPMWTRTHGESETEDFAEAVAIDRSGNIVVAGLEGLTLVPNTSTAWIGKYDSTGNIVSEYTRAEDGDGLARAIDIAIDSMGNVVVGGCLALDFSNADGVGWLAKLDPDLNLLWERFWNEPGSGYECVHAVAVDSTDSIFAGGVIRSVHASPLFEVLDPDVDAHSRLQKYQPNGDPAWIDPVDLNGNRVLSALACRPNGNVVAAGGITELGEDRDIWASEYDPAGVLVSALVHDGPAGGNDTAMDVAIAPDGAILVAGGVNSVAGELRFEALDMVLLRVESGTVVWERWYDGPAGHLDLAYGVAVDSTGNAIMVGETTNSASNDIWLRKYGPDGAVLWTQFYDGESLGTDAAFDVDVDANDELVAVGLLSIGTYSNIWTGRYGP